MTYGAITPRTSEDLAKPDALNHPSSSSSSFWAANGCYEALVIKCGATILEELDILFVTCIQMQDG